MVKRKTFGKWVILVRVKKSIILTTFFKGPCGPCSEIHFDRIGGRDASAMVNADDPTVIEIWNNVFIQFNREADKSLTTLPDKHVDTGMGFERIASVLQCKMSNYDTDVFGPIFAAIQKATGSRDYTGKLGKEDVDGIDTAYRVLADHIRTLTIAISDGGMPDASGRGYILRRIVRRAARFGDQFMNAKPGFFAELVDSVVTSLGDFFPELKTDPAFVKKIIKEEEEQFAKTLKKGIKLFEEIAKKTTGTVISGDDAFVLYGTYGFPIDLTKLMAEEKGMTVDMKRFEVCKEQAIEDSKGEKEKGANIIVFQPDQTDALKNKFNLKPTDDGTKYTWNDLQGATVQAIYSKELGFSNNLNAGVFAGVVLDKTNYYAESGGQVYDIGTISNDAFEFAVSNVQVYSGYVVHMGQVTRGTLNVGDSATLKVNLQRRAPIASNHTATHMLNFGLRQVLGVKVDQKGSLVEPDKLRFDFSLNSAPKPEDIHKVENIVRDLIKKDLSVYSQVSSLTEAKQFNGLRAVFGEAYPDPVRVISIGVPIDQLAANPSNPEWANYSIEFCGGTHLSKTSEAENFAIVTESSIAKGIRRIVAYTKDKAAKVHQETDAFEQKIVAANSIKDDAEFASKLSELNAELEGLTVPVGRKEQIKAMLSKGYDRVKQAAKQKEKEVTDKAKVVAEQVIAGVNEKKQSYAVVYLKATDFGANQRVAAQAIFDTFKSKAKETAVFVLAVDGDKVVMICNVPNALTSKLNAMDWFNSAGTLVNAKGGGKGGFVQGQGSNASSIDAAVAAAQQFVQSKF